MSFFGSVNEREQSRFSSFSGTDILNKNSRNGEDEITSLRKKDKKNSFTNLHVKRSFVDESLKQIDVFILKTLCSFSYLLNLLNINEGTNI